MGHLRVDVMRPRPQVEVLVMDEHRLAEDAGPPAPERPLPPVAIRGADVTIEIEATIAPRGVPAGAVDRADMQEGDVAGRELDIDEPRGVEPRLAQPRLAHRRVHDGTLDRELELAE